MSLAAAIVSLMVRLDPRWEPYEGKPHVPVRESELSTDGQTRDIPGSDAILLRVMCS